MKNIDVFMHSKEYHVKLLSYLFEVVCIGSHLDYFLLRFQLKELESQVYCGKLP